MKYLILTTLFILMFGCNKESAQEFATVEVHKATVQNVVSLTGRAEAAQQITLMAPEDITVLKLEASNGQKVKEGDVLCQLDPRKAQEQIRTEENKREQMLAGIKTAEIRLEGQKRDLEKSLRLFRSGAVSQDEKDKQAQEVEIQATQLTVLKGDLKNLEVSLEKLKHEATLLEIKAPFDAVVTYIWIAKDSFIPGSSVKKGDLLFKLSSEGKMAFKATLREQDVTHFSQGQKLNLRFPGIPGVTAEGVIKLVDNAATVDKDSGVASFRINIEFTPPPQVKPGMETMVEHVVSIKENVLSIPKTALNMASGQSVEVMTIDQGKKLKKAIKIGLIGDTNVEVISGLNNNERVLASYEE